MATDTRHGKNSGSMSTAGSHEVPTRRATAAASDMRRHESSRDYSSGPFGLMRQMQDEVDRWFDRAGLGRGWTSPSAWAAAPSSWMSRAAEAVGDWTPAIDAFQRNNEFVVRLDVPGMTRSDLNVEVGEDTLTISGERKQEHTDERDGMFWSERSYGTFSRVVPLPPGAISDSAKATFNNGVLEIVMQAPSQATRRGRKIDISGHDHESGKKTV